MTVHTILSHIKSAIRVVGYVVLAPATPEFILIGAIILTIAEGVGILEEVFGA